MARVVRGSVVKTVAATGTLQAVTEQKLGFGAAGKLVSLPVVVGQRVRAGQVLAQLDDFAARRDLDAARARLARARARLGLVVDDNAARAAAHDSARARDVVAAHREQAEAVDRANREAAEAVRERLAEDRRGLRAARQAQAVDQARCNR